MSSSLKDRFKDALYHLRHPEEYPDKKETLNLFKILAEDESYAPAQTYMAYFSEASGEKEKALEWLEKAVAQGDSEAMCSKGKWHYEGKNGLEKDYKKAMEYYSRAASLENASAIVNLGLMYEEGEGCEADVFKAAELFRSLTKYPGEEDRDACFHLGRLCLMGNLGPGDRIKAEGIVNMNEAADMGHPGAKEIVETLGISRHKIEASIQSSLSEK